MNESISYSFNAMTRDQGRGKGGETLPYDMGDPGPKGVPWEKKVEWGEKKEEKEKTRPYTRHKMRSRSYCQ